MNAIYWMSSSQKHQKLRNTLLLMSLSGQEAHADGHFLKPVESEEKEWKATCSLLVLNRRMQ
jgi:hypothetical protein